MTYPFGLGGPSPEQVAERNDAWVAAVSGQVADRLAELIREVDGDHSSGPAGLSEELVKRGVTVQPGAVPSDESTRRIENGDKETDMDRNNNGTTTGSSAAGAAESQHEKALPEPVQNVQVFTGEPTDLRRLSTLEQVAAMPDGTVVIWNDDRDDRQAGVLETEDERGRVVRPISIGRYEDDWYLGAVLPPVWVVTFDDPPEIK